MISLASLAVVIYLTNWRQLSAALRLADYRLVLLGTLLTLVWLGVRGFVWRTLLQDQASYGQVFLTLNEGYLLNNLLPFRLGEVGRAFLLGRKASLGFWQVLSTIFIERSLDLALAVGLMLSTLPFVVGAGWARQAALGVGVLVLGAFAALYLLALNRLRAIALFERISARWSFLNRLGGAMLLPFLNGLAILTDSRLFLRALAWMLANWLVSLLQYYCFMRAFFPHTLFFWGAFALAAGALGLAAPSSPGGVGVMELSLVAALSALGLNASTALAFAVTLHLNQYLITGVLGAYALLRDGESLAGLYRRVRQARDAQETV